MQSYQNNTGRSNITGFQINSESIEVEFTNGSTYTYSYSSAGEDIVEEMKKLALGGSGLAAFINANAKYDYE